MLRGHTLHQLEYFEGVTVPFIRSWPSRDWSALRAKGVGPTSFWVECLAKTRFLGAKCERGGEFAKTFGWIPSLPALRNMRGSSFPTQIPTIGVGGGSGGRQKARGDSSIFCNDVPKTRNRLFVCFLVSTALAICTAEISRKSYLELKARMYKAPSHFVKPHIKHFGSQHHPCRTSAQKIPYLLDE